MSLRDHARAARLIGESIRGQVSGNLLDPENVIFMGLSVALREAADRMEEQAAADIVAIGGACTLNHEALKGPQRCPACNAPKP